jgi:hypothetical protein
MSILCGLVNAAECHWGGGLVSLVVCMVYIRQTPANVHAHVCLATPSFLVDAIWPYQCGSALQVRFEPLCAKIPILCFLFLPMWCSGVHMHTKLT